MPQAATPSALAFSALRPRLFSIAYRMLGVRADAEDVVQDAWLRWDGSDQAALQSPEAWLVTIVTRLALDRLRVAKAERESYAGWWLPEPLVEMDERTPETQAEMAGELGVAFMWVLERLSPDERAAFLLRQVFDYDYGEVAALLGKSEAACRQMVHRAQERVQQDKKRYGVNNEAHRSLLGKFLDAARTGQAAAIQALLAANVELVSDGGGKVPSFPRIIHGMGAVTRLFCRTLDKYPGQVEYRTAMLNGEPGFLRYIGGKLESAQAILVVDGLIAGIYAVRNPDKLTGVPQTI
ncbi:RNA polymerase sigma factor SigJ [Pseudoduganella aquatica]|uniref:Sigma-70 family RNA polymerase sigma factor n=1 Tax=Pseudoduganella aquatica TaxID=2660641 RepID=A0A7X4KPR5_9BURK|nr:RNA polymerase sigma factor SigJ [Pseudoduganella aquatica]MYN10543.1 sigma-70 family RNA polymerase sigma factor [Pseudoduganella aquatica]